MTREPGPDAADTVPSSPAAARRPRRYWTWALGVPVVLFALVVLGVFAPVPLVWAAISSAVTSAAVYLVLVALLLTAAAVFLVRHGRTTARLVLVALTVLSVVGTAVVGGRQLAMAGDQDVDVSIASTFDLVEGDVDPDDTVVYTSYEGEDVPLSIWRPDGATDGAAPVVFMVHGGGWVSGSSTEGTPPGHAAWLAARGYLVISADYSLSDDDRHLWDVVEGQIGCALAWTGQNAADYGGDVSRLGLVGDSAGGNLVLEAAYKGNAGELAPSCGGDIPEVSAVSTLYPAVDLTAAYANPPAQTFAEQYLGGSPSEFPERYAAVSPSEHVSDDAPPTLITLGGSDHLVPPAATHAFYEQLQDAGIESDLIEVPYGEHVFDWAPGGIGSQVFRAATLRWLADHGV